MSDGSRVGCEWGEPCPIEAERDRLRTFVEEIATLDDYHGPYGASSEEQWTWDTEKNIAEKARQFLRVIPVPRGEKQ